MIRYIKLVHYELFRFRKIYFSLFLITLLLQFAGLYLFAQSYMARVHDNMANASMPWGIENAIKYAGEHGLISFYNYASNSLWFAAPIALCITALLLYMFLIWYRDWLGKNMFIYRLLMLPASRMGVYMAKISAVFLMVLGLVAFQLMILPLQNLAFNAMIPNGLRADATVAEIIRNHVVLRILIPQTFTEFVIYYGLGLASIIVVSTGLLIERSYRLKGAIGGILYFGLSIGIFVLPIIISEKLLPPNYLYPSEIIALEAAAGILISAGSLWLSLFLLHKKVTV